MTSYELAFNIIMLLRERCYRDRIMCIDVLDAVLRPFPKTARTRVVLGLYRSVEVHGEILARGDLPVDEQKQVARVLERDLARLSGWFERHGLMVTDPDVLDEEALHVLQLSVMAGNVAPSM